jgi:hypothetical protein
VTADRAEERQRISGAIEQAQRAQAGVLLAGLGADGADQPKDAGNQAAALQI